MPIEIRKALDRDLRRCAEIGHQAFANNPFFKVKFPGYVPKDGFLGLRTDDLSRQLREDPTARMFVAVDTERRGDSAVVGFAKWNVYPSGMPYAKSTPSSWGAAANVDVCKAVFGGVEEMRNRLMAGKPSICEFPPWSLDRGHHEKDSPLRHGDRRPTYPSHGPDVSTAWCRTAPDGFRHSRISPSGYSNLPRVYRSRPLVVFEHWI